MVYESDGTRTIKVKPLPFVIICGYVGYTPVVIWMVTTVQY